MRSKTLIGLLITAALTATAGAQTTAAEEQSLRDAVRRAYIDGMIVRGDEAAVRAGYHEGFLAFEKSGRRLEATPLTSLLAALSQWRRAGGSWADRVSADITVLGQQGPAAAVKVVLSLDGTPHSVDFLSLMKAAGDWKIVSMASADVPLEGQALARWEQANNERQPPDRVMDAVGVKPGMVIGEVGAGRGRYTLPLARRVGPAGRVLANDIDEDALAVLKSRCREEGLSQVDIVLGLEDDPRFPSQALDMVVMVWVYHHIESAVPFLRNLKSSLKPGATVVILDPAYERTKEKDSDRPSTRASVEREARQAGFELVRVDGFLPRDDIFILRPTPESGSRS